MIKNYFIGIKGVLLLHNLEIFRDKCDTLKDEYYSTLEYYHYFNMYPMLKKIINTNDIINLKQWIINNNLKSRKNFPVTLLFGDVEFRDKFTILLLEYLCYYIIKELKINVYINGNIRKNILTEEAVLSPINFLKVNNPNYSIRKFEKYFDNDIKNNHYRRYLDYKHVITSDLLCKLYDEVIYFQRNSGVEESSAEEVAEVIIELIGNACEHGKEDCLVDIDVAQNYSKKDLSGKLYGDYYAINISIVNFSDKLFSDDIERKLKLLIKSNNADGRYLKLINTFNTHKKFFNNKYTRKHFYLIAAFQDKISGRLDNNYTGGTGLKKLIQGLQRKSDASACYMQTGELRFSFIDSYLDYNEDYWIGFNKDNDFFGKPPYMNLFFDKNFFMPGTAYNLTFVYERKCEKNERDYFEV